MSASNAKIAFFDVDKTLCDCYSGYHTTLELMRRRIIKKRRILQAIFYNAIGRIYVNADVKRMYEIAISDMAGTHIDDILRIGKDAFDKYVKPTMYIEALAEIEMLRREGFLIALLSSAPAMMVKNIELFLKADASFSNGPEIVDGILQKKFREPLCYKEGKVQVAKEFADSQGVGFADCRFYSDSISDLPLLSQVGHPWVVNPDSKLRREAERRNWPILHFKETIGRKGL
ncbi:MAG TPA: HAD-IB family hydrolase [bacterium]|nr:HAD-IB family hydrolase [bacterium]